MKPHNLSRFTAILSHLSLTPINYNWANKPIASLGAIYFAAMPQTSAPLDVRIQALETLAKKFPDTRLPDSVIDEAPGSEFKHMAEDKRVAMTAVATANGFKDLDDWSVVGSSIAMSYTYAIQGKKPGEVTKAINMHIAEVKEDSRLNAEQKDAQIAQLQQFGQKLGRLEPLPENYALVEQMKDKVAPIMNFE